MTGRHKPELPGMVPGVRQYVIVAEKAAAPGAPGKPPWAQKKKRSDAKPDLGPSSGRTIDGEKEPDTDPADPNYDTPDHGSGADARPYDQTQRPQAEDEEPPGKDDSLFSSMDDTPVPGVMSDEPDQPDTMDPNDSQSTGTVSDAGQSWAGDLDDTGDVSDPTGAFANFTAPDGTTAWLDRAPDGTLTGWVQTPQGQTYRYTDADAWAIDVDDAGMTPAADSTNPPAATDQSPDSTDPNAESSVATSTSGADPMQAGLQGKARRVIRRTGIPAPAPRQLARVRGVLLEVKAAEKDDSPAEQVIKMPDGSYPIATQKDAQDAWDLRGRDKKWSKAQVTAHILAACKELGLKFPGSRPATQ